MATGSIDTYNQRQLYLKMGVAACLIAKATVLMLVLSS